MKIIDATKLRPGLIMQARAYSWFAALLAREELAVTSRKKGK